MMFAGLPVPDDAVDDLGSLVRAIGGDDLADRLEDRTPDRRVFQGVTEATAYQTMTRACQTAGVPHYHPHDLRHRRITIWHQSGVPARELAERAGHARPSMSLDVFSHVMPPDEIVADKFLHLLSGGEVSKR